MSQLFYLPQAVRVDSSGAPYAGAKANFYLTGTTTRTNTFTDSALSVAHDNPVVADSAGQFAPIYLVPGTTYRCVITESDDTQIDDVDPVRSPLTASDIAIVDNGNYYAGIEVETALADVGANYAKRSDAGTWTADQTFSGATLKMADEVIERAEIKDYSVTHQSISSVMGKLTIDLTTGNSFVTTLTENITDVVINNASPTGKYCQFTIKVIQDGAGGAYTVDFEASETVLWPGGTAPTITAANDAIDKVTLETIDEGTTWIGNFSQAYA
jgi:hypothetical protein